MKVIICTVALGGWYLRGVSRMIEAFHNVSPGYEIQAHVNTLPFGAPANVIENDYDYTGYCSKPFALMAARNAGADVAVLIDAAFFPIRPIQPLVDHIARRGYYLCKNGNLVGEWSSDRCLERLGILRQDAYLMEEASSYCVGLNFADGRSTELLQRWCGAASDRLTFPGPHTSAFYCMDCHASGRTSPFSDGEICPKCNGRGLIPRAGRNPGLVSSDPRVRGHRHDQTALSIIAHQIGMHELIERPRFTAYQGSETGETVLVNRGM